jgi:hypothetical protein
MDLLLKFIIGGCIAYALLKLSLYIYRPFFLSKTFREIDEIYDKLLNATEKDISSATKDLEKWRSGDKVTIDFHTEDELIEILNSAKRVKAHEQEVREKFMRLKERFLSNPAKLSELIVAYKRYLEVRSEQYQEAGQFARALTTGAISFEELLANKRMKTIALEENERKLDTLLNETGQEQQE